jgi:hypothetical protein
MKTCGTLILILVVLPPNIFFVFYGGFPLALLCSSSLIIGSALTGNWVLVPGLLCNGIAIIANHGAMPVYGITTVEGDLRHVVAGPNTVFPFLCDWLPGRSSIGDWLLLLGLVFCFFNIWHNGRSSNMTQVRGTQ